mmetsp:Transcript_6622/g.9362  ORF Transcript_6622/g.9362 Transcript_6622/m.9362 type:complete len:119 (+) Transcript_6622:358-714(+)
MRRALETLDEDFDFDLEQFNFDQETFNNEAPNDIGRRLKVREAKDTKVPKAKRSKAPKSTKAPKPTKSPKMRRALETLDEDFVFDLEKFKELDEQLKELDEELKKLDENIDFRVEQYN